MHFYFLQTRYFRYFRLSQEILQSYFLGFKLRELKFVLTEMDLALYMFKKINL